MGVFGTSFVTHRAQLRVLAERERVQVIRERRLGASRGFTLLELTFAVAMCAVLGAIAVGGYTTYVSRVRVSRAVADIGDIQLAVDRFQLNRAQFPDSLGDLGFGARLDPWGAPYEYLNFATVMGVGQMRKDRNLVPINTDYDLYSMGPDGGSVAPLTAPVSQDDIVRANDGNFIGVAEDY